MRLGKNELTILKILSEKDLWCHYNELRSLFMKEIEGKTKKVLFSQALFQLIDKGLVTKLWFVEGGKIIRERLPDVFIESKTKPYISKSKYTDIEITGKGLEELKKRIKSKETIT